MRSWSANALVFGTSAAVLVLEIVAGRLLAPYVGISLETFTAIIGTVLAGIALGAALGGRLADHRDPHPLIAAALVIGGGLTWLSLPIVTAGKDWTRRLRSSIAPGARRISSWSNAKAVVVTPPGRMKSALMVTSGCASGASVIATVIEVVRPARTTTSDRTTVR